MVLTFCLAVFGSAIFVFSTVSLRNWYVVSRICMYIDRYCRFLELRHTYMRYSLYVPKPVFQYVDTTAYGTRVPTYIPRNRPIVVLESGTRRSHKSKNPMPKRKYLASEDKS